VVARPGAAAADLQPGDVAGLLVEGDDDARVALPQGRGERRELVEVDDVAPEQRNTAEPFVQPSQHPNGRGHAGEAGLEDPVRPDSNLVCHGRQTNL
jgi:hypothetical protein